MEGAAGNKKPAKQIATNRKAHSNYYLWWKVWPATKWRPNEMPSMSKQMIIFLKTHPCSYGEWIPGVAGNTDDA